MNIIRFKYKIDFEKGGYYIKKQIIFLGITLFFSMGTDGIKYESTNEAQIALDKIIKKQYSE